MAAVGIAGDGSPRQQIRYGRHKHPLEAHPVRVNDPLSAQLGEHAEGARGDGGERIAEHGFGVPSDAYPKPPERLR
jgi:hypothetical protein